MRERVISMDSGPALRTAETSLTGTTSATASDISLGSNGSDFLIAWIDNPCARGGCDVVAEYHLSVQQVGANGSPLDSKPLVLDATEAREPSIAWNGSSYVVTWEEWSGIKASRIAADGGFLGDRHAVLLLTAPDIDEQRIVAAGRDLLLLATRRNGPYGNTATTTGMTLDPESLVATGSPTLIATDQPTRSGLPTLSVAALPAGFVVAYDRADPNSSDPGRVFSRIFANAARRRATR